MTSPARVLELLSDLRAQRRAAEDQLASVDAALGAVERTLSLLNPGAENQDESEPASPPEFSPYLFAGKSQLQAIIMVAEGSGGVVTVKEAKRMLLETRLTGSKKCASQVATSTIVRSGRFEWIAPGAYRLLSYPRLVRAS